MIKIYFLLFIGFISSNSYSQKIRVTGKWTKTLSAKDIESPGNDYNSYFTSKSNQSRISITPVPNSKYNRKYMPFKVFIHKEVIEWHNDLTIESRVSSTKHGNSSGTTYQEITNHTSLFFNTIGKQKDIPIQYRISGLSVTIPAETYVVEIVYTVLNL